MRHHSSSGQVTYHTVFIKKANINTEKEVVELEFYQMIQERAQ